MRQKNLDHIKELDETEKPDDIKNLDETKKPDDTELDETKEQDNRPNMTKELLSTNRTNGTKELNDTGRNKKVVRTRIDKEIYLKVFIPIGVFFLAFMLYYWYCCGTNSETPGEVVDLQFDLPGTQPVTLFSDPTPGRRRTFESQPTKNVNSTEECVVCMSAAKSIAVIPCGHKCCCVGCADVLQTTFSSCPICRAPIQDLCKIFE